MSKSFLYVVGDLQFEWDEAKAEGNYKKHGLTFREGATVFKDYGGILLEDPDAPGEEVRFELLGYSVSRRMAVVVHAERGARLRIVSVRPATKLERRLYEESKG